MAWYYNWRCLVCGAIRAEEIDVCPRCKLKDTYGPMMPAGEKTLLTVALSKGKTMEAKGTVLSKHWAIGPWVVGSKKGRCLLHIDSGYPAIYRFDKRAVWDIWVVDLTEEIRRDIETADVKTIADNGAFAFIMHALSAD